MLYAIGFAGSILNKFSLLPVLDLTYPYLLAWLYLNSIRYLNFPANNIRRFFLYISWIHVPLSKWEIRDHFQTPMYIYNNSFPIFYISFFPSIAKICCYLCLKSFLYKKRIMLVNNSTQNHWMF